MGTINDPWPKRSIPAGHPADGMFLQVDMGGGAWMTIADPRSYGGLLDDMQGPVWTLTWGDAEAIKYSVASAMESFDYLLSSNINMAEATRRLRELRRVRALALSGRAPVWHPPMAEFPGFLSATPPQAQPQDAGQGGATVKSRGGGERG